MAIVINGSGTVTGLAVGGLPDGTVDAGTLATDSVTAAKLEVSAITNADLPAGNVLQVVSTTKSDLFTLTSLTFTDVTGLAATITPTSSSSTILVVVNMMMSAHRRYAAVKLLRGSTVIGIGDAASNRARVTMGCSSNDQETNGIYVSSNASATYKDSPSTTSATTYKIQVGSLDDPAAAIKINSGSADADAAYTTRGISTITLFEIGA